ncbi:MAG TPA: heavy-metal-associated domain-containing protein [Thermomicrobiales bacterium]|nr:heavy-metal-associated domain-containing protein [Thermomicrobiales bacterium]
MTEKTYLVPDVSCEHCVRAIQTELESIPGVDVLGIDIPTKLVTVRYDESVVEDQIVAGIEDAGYEIAHPAA